MKSLIITAACAVALAFAYTTRAEDEEKELKGEGMCLKCELKKSEKCQNVLRVKDKDGKETLYYAEKNDVSDAFHKNLCSGIKKVTAKGKVKKDGDKHMLTISKIELDEKK